MIIPPNSISIHSPRMGRDMPLIAYIDMYANFNPLSPHGERLTGYNTSTIICPISIHSPRMGRDSVKFSGAQNLTISIHSPRMGRDTLVRGQEAEVRFQSTLPAWGETETAGYFIYCLNISIHSPRMGRDYMIKKEKACIFNFNPLSPHGERHTDSVPPALVKIFQSTLPAWGETIYKRARFKHDDFNPLSPHGERHLYYTVFPDPYCISIHSPRMGRDAVTHTPH